MRMPVNSFSTTTARNFWRRRTERFCSSAERACESSANTRRPLFLASTSRDRSSDLPFSLSLLTVRGHGRRPARPERRTSCSLASPRPERRTWCFFLHLHQKPRPDRLLSCPLSSLASKTGCWALRRWRTSCLFYVPLYPFHVFRLFRQFRFSACSFDFFDCVRPFPFSPFFCSHINEWMNDRPVGIYTRYMQVYTTNPKTDDIDEGADDGLEDQLGFWDHIQNDAGCLGEQAVSVSITRDEGSFSIPAYLPLVRFGFTIDI